ncbi:MAG: hypothetical protein IJK83_06085, partial [Clostridiales bacterium]|nr:hypothetical protein [Clostridiales bacterium]
DGGLPSSINPLMLKQRPDLTPVCLLCLVVSKQKPANRLLIFVSRFLFAIKTRLGLYFLISGGSFFSDGKQARQKVQDQQ